MLEKIVFTKDKTKKYINLMQENPEEFNRIREEEKYKSIVIEDVSGLVIRDCKLKGVIFKSCHDGTWICCHDGDWVVCLDGYWKSCYYGNWKSCHDGTWTVLITN